jgi:hypothetical protein
MTQAIAAAFSYGVGVALSPGAVIAAVLILDGEGGTARAALFSATWAVSLAVVATVALLLADGADASSGSPADWVVAAQVVIAFLLVLVAAGQVRERVRGGGASEMPGWMRKVDGLTTGRAVAMAVFLASAKPKNLLLSIGAGIAVSELGVAATSQAGGIAAFVLIGTLAPLAPLAMSVALGERSAATLSALREWMVRESSVIVGLLCLVFAAKLLGDALA